MDSDDPDGNTIAFQLLLLLFLTLVNAFFAGAEMAVVSVNKNKIKKLAEDGNRKAMLIQTLLEDSTKFLSTIQVAITFAGFFSSASAATGISQILGNWMGSFGLPYSNTIAVVLVTIVLSYFTLVFGELVPKRIALQKAEWVSLFSVKPIYMIWVVLSPFIKLRSLSTNGFLHIIGMKTDNLEEAISEEEIKAMLETGSETGVFNETEKEMINSIFSFDDKTARDVMVSRREVFAVDAEEPLGDYLDDILEYGYSRMPVYSGTIDNIIGVLYMKDFIVEMRKTAFSDLDIRSIMRPAYCVPDSKNADVLFREMQQTQNRMAILIDEYGGFSGIVTMEDLVEEIVGDLQDEREPVEEELKKLDDYTYLVDGSMLVEDVNDKLHLNLQTGSYDTVSGFLIEHLGYIPKKGQDIQLTIEDNVFKIQEMADKRISKVLLKLPEEKKTA